MAASDAELVVAEAFDEAMVPAGVVLTEAAMVGALVTEGSAGWEGFATALGEATLGSFCRGGENG